MNILTTHYTIAVVNQTAPLLGRARNGNPNNQSPYPRTGPPKNSAPRNATPARATQTNRNGSFSLVAGDGEGGVTRVLFCGPSYYPASQSYTREYLAKYPFIQVDDVALSEVADVISNYDMCVVKSMLLDADVLSRAKRMKIVMQYGVGIEGVDVDAARRCGIKVARIPSGETGNAASCAEMSIYLMLGLLRKQHKLRISVQGKKVGEPIGDTLFGKTVFILGYGNIGFELAKRVKPFGVKIVATKRGWPLHYYNDGLVDEKGTHEEIHKFASKADIVVCCLGMNKQTVGIVNKPFISSMRKGSLLINIARGGLVEYSAVFEYLKSGHLGGLATDVAWTEPFDPEDPILKLDNVILTPHIGGITELSFRSMAKVVGDVALQLHSGKDSNYLKGIEFVN